MFCTVYCEDADRSEVPKDRSARKSAYYKTHSAYQNIYTSENKT